MSNQTSELNAPRELNANAIGPKFVKEFQLHDLHNPRFLPRDQFGPLTESKLVERTIKKHCPRSNVKRLVEYSTGNPRVFLTCVFFGEVSSIPSCHDAGFKDESLPVEGTTEDSAIHSFHSKQKWDWTWFRNEQGHWGWYEKDRFIDSQWPFSAMIFKDDEFSFKIPRTWPLPYIPLEKATKGKQGHFGEVHKIGLLAKHFENAPPRYSSLVSLAQSS